MCRIKLSNYFFKGNHFLKKAGIRFLPVIAFRGNDCLRLDNLCLRDLGVDVNGSLRSKLTISSRLGSDLCVGGVAAGEGIGNTFSRFRT